MRRGCIHRNLHFHGDWSRLKWFHTHARWKQDRFQSINRHHYVSRHSMHRLRSDCISRVQRHVRAKRRINAGQFNERKGEGAGGLKSFGHDLGRRGRGEGWELNKCLPAEICVPIFETPEFPRTAKWHHTFAALSSLSPRVRLTCGSIFPFLRYIHTYAPKFTWVSDTLVYGGTKRKLAFPAVNVISTISKKFIV